MSVVPWRQARPNESLTITARSAPVSSRSRPRNPAAEASGSSGSSTSVPPCGAFEASTPAEAQTKPCPVSAITSGGRVRTSRALSRRITSSRRGSSSAARSRARAEGSISASRTTRPSALETALCATTTTSPSSSSAAAAIRAARSSPSRTSGSPFTGITRSSPRGLCNRPLLVVRNAGELETSVSPVLPVDVDDHRSQRLERTRVRERAGVERTAADELGRNLESRLLRSQVVAAHQGIFLCQLVPREIDRRDRLQAGGHGRVDAHGDLFRQRPPLASRQDAELREDDVARDTEQRRRADRALQPARGLDRRARLDREHDQVGALDGLLVGPAAHAELDPPLPAAIVVAGADRDVEAEVTQARGERPPEGAGAADNRDVHQTATRPRTVSTSAARASDWDISVLVTRGSTPRSATASASPLSASSRTSVPMSPL